MKKLLLVGAVALMGTFANAQENSIKANPAALLGGSDLITFEHKFSDNMSGVIGAGYGGFKFGGSKYTTYGAGVQGRYYFEEAMTGFYGAAIVDYTSGKVKIENPFSGIFGVEETSTNETDLSAIGGGVRAGYQWIFDSGFTIDLNLGASYKSFTYKNDNGSNDNDFSGLKASGVLPTGSLGLGYSF